MKKYDQNATARPDSLQFSYDRLQGSILKRWASASLSVHFCDSAQDPEQSIIVLWYLITKPSPFSSLLYYSNAMWH